MRSDCLEGLRVVSTALNLPGPAACARLRELGAAVTKVEPPAGDPFERYCPAWYARLHEGVTILRLDLKSGAGRAALDTRLAEADLLLTAQRPAALARLGLDPASLAARHPRLCAVAITGHAAPHEDLAGHDLTYMAAAGLVTPPALPPTLFADMAGSERAVSLALALVIRRERTRRGSAATAPLEEAATLLAGPRDEGLTKPGALLGGGNAAYNVYATKRGWIAVAALEPHFERSLAAALGLTGLDAATLAERFAAQGAAHWEAWARERDLPIAALRPLPPDDIP